MLFGIGVDVLDHRGERGGLPAPGSSGHKHDPPWRLGNLFDLLEQSQLFEAWHMRFYIAHRQTPLAALLEKVGPEPADVRNKIGKIGFTLLIISDRDASYADYQG